MKLKASLVLIVCSSLMSNVVFADVNSAMNSYMNNISVTGNAATITHTQSANVMSAGGFATRSQSVTLQPFSFSPPSFSSSCGNIDFYGGSFSYLSNTDQLMKFLQNTIVTAAPLIFMQALKVISPDLQGSIQEFFDAAQKLVNLASNSCQLGTYLGTMAGTALGNATKDAMGANAANGDGGVAAYTTGSSKNGDNGQSGTLGLKAAATTINSWASTMNGILNPTYNDSNAQLADKAGVFGSVVWMGLQNIANVQSTGLGGSSNMQDLANLIISVTGDIYFGNGGGNDSVKLTSYVVPDQIGIDSLYNKEAGPTNLVAYNCQRFRENNKPNDFCYLNGGSTFSVPTTVAVTWTILDKVNTMIKAISDNLNSNKPLTDDNLYLIAICKLPVFQMGQALYDAGMGYQLEPFLRQYNSQIAFDIVYQLLNESLKLAMQAAMSKDTSDPKVKGDLDILVSRINMQMAILNKDALKYGQVNPVAMMNDINSLRSYAQTQYAPSLIQKIQFAKSFNNH